MRIGVVIPLAMAALIVSAPVLAQAPAAQEITRTYNKFNNFTAVEAPVVQLPSDVSVRLSYLCTGNVQGCRPHALVLFLSQQSDEWRHLDDNDVILLLNGNERVPLGTADHDGSAEEGYVIEFRTLQIPLLLARRIASAQTVELQWSLTQITLPASVQANLRSLLLTMPVATK